MKKFKDLEENFIFYDEDTDSGGDNTESKLIEDDDGNLAVKVDADEEPAKDPDKGQTGADKSKSGDTDADEDPLYAGKSREDIIGLHKDSMAHATKAQQEASRVKQSINTREDVKGVATAKELRKAVDKQIKVHADIDGITHEVEKAEAEVKLEAMKLDLRELQDKERYNDQVNDGTNSEFLKAHKETLKKAGIVLTDDEYANISETSKEYAEGGKVTERSVQKAILDEVGIEKFNAFIKTQAEQKLRGDLKNAGLKEDKSLTPVSTRTATGKSVNIDDMTVRETIAHRRTLTGSDLQKFDRYVEKRILEKEKG